jgi:hypothetical protein
MFQEKEKGSLKAGKKADFIVLDRNPLAADPQTMKEIKVIKTYKNGRLIYEGDLHD